jgi:hypothetical protein
VQPKARFFVKETAGQAKVGARIVKLTKKDVIRRIDLYIIIGDRGRVESLKGNIKRGN